MDLVENEKETVENFGLKKELPFVSTNSEDIIYENGED